MALDNSKALVDGAALSSVAAFFDLDGTLLSVNTGELWMRRERRLGRISRWQVMQALLYLWAYRLGTIDMESAMAKVLSFYRGEREDVFRQWQSEWFLREVASKVSPQALQTLDCHRRAGHCLVLLTSSSAYVAQTAARLWGVDHWISTRCEVRDGVFTGEAIRPLCFSEGKVALAESFAHKHRIDLDQSYFYTDSYTDISMLRRVGRPRVVNPDRRLHRRARRYGWPVFDWRQPLADSGNRPIGVADDVQR